MLFLIIISVLNRTYGKHQNHLKKYGLFSLHFTRIYFAFFSANKLGTCEYSANKHLCEPAIPPKAGLPPFGSNVTARALPWLVWIDCPLWVECLSCHWRESVISAYKLQCQRHFRLPWRRRPGRSTLGRVALPARWVARAHPVVGEQAPLWPAVFLPDYFCIVDPPHYFGRPPRSWGGLPTTAIDFD